ncbi:hypothetical protein PQX77_007261 [Marasmius sp. AFHP31]|nr:hypothetical protein PQX77_007261 [Marasmius sp. AFHP31]
MQPPNYATPYYSQAAYYPNQPYEANGNSNYTPFYPSYQSPWPNHAAARQTPYAHPSQFPQPSAGNQQRNNTQPGLGSAMPLKSSLKRNDTVPANAGATPAAQPTPLRRRRRTKSNPQNLPEAQGTLQRQRTTSNPQAPQALDTDYPTRMFLTLHGSDEIHIENLSELAMQEIRSTIFPIWPYGMVLDELRDLDWRVRFNNSPWSATGVNATKSLEMLVALFTRFARRGYSFQTSLSNGTSTPRLVFLATNLDDACKYFFAHPLSGGKKITFINPPTHIRDNLFDLLQQHSKVRGHIEPHYDEETTTFSIELRQGLYTGEKITAAHLLAAVLHKLDYLNATLETSIPMARRGPFAKLGFGSRPEFFLFKVSPS